MWNLNVLVRSYILGNIHIRFEYNIPIAYFFFIKYTEPRLSEVKSWFSMLLVFFLQKLYYFARVSFSWSLRKLYHSSFHSTLLKFVRHNLRSAATPNKLNPIISASAKETTTFSFCFLPTAFPVHKAARGDSTSTYIWGIISKVVGLRTDATVGCKLQTRLLTSKALLFGPISNYIWSAVYFVRFTSLVL